MLLAPHTQTSMIFEDVAVESASISEEVFNSKYGDIASPVLLQGAAKNWSAMEWSQDTLTRTCGDRKLDQCSHGQPYRLAAHANFRGWVRHGKTLEAIHTQEYGSKHNETLATVADLFRMQQKGHNLHLHAASVDILCTELLDDFGVPMQLRTDYTVQLPSDISEPVTHRCASSRTGKAIAPTITLGPAGAHAPIHIERGSYRLWMAVVKGAKKVRLCSPDDIQALYPKLHEDDWNVHPQDFHADLFEPDFEKFPLLEELRILEATVMPGDVIFIPEGWAHQFSNEEYTISLAYHFVDTAGLPHHMIWLYNTMWHKNPEAKKLDERERQQRELQYIWYHSSESAKHYAEYRTHVDPANLTWAHFFERQRLQMPEDKTIFDMMEDKELETLMRFSVGHNHKTPEAEARWAGNSIDLHAFLAEGETLPHTYVPNTGDEL